MKSLISVNSLSKSYGAKQLFQNLSLNIFTQEKVAIIGKNGSGKSTLLKILAGLEELDAGDLVRKKNLRVAYVPQSPTYDKDLTVEQVLEKEMHSLPGDESEKSLSRIMALSLCGFEDYSQKVGVLSGGWVKRLSIACAISHDPELLMLDEPTNHMDWDAIKWLEEFLNNWEHAFVLVSHDRSFLNNTTKRTIEIGAAFLNEHLSFDLSFDAFLERRALYFEEQQKLSESLGNKARRELDWLRAGVKARTTKSRARINEAHELFKSLDQVKGRIRASKQNLKLGVDESGRRSKKLISLEDISKAYGDNKLFTDLNLVLSPKTRLALLGDNGSGKTTLVKILMGEIEADSGVLKFADNLKRVYFDQSKAKLNLEENIFEFLSEGGDHVQFRGQSMHVASYASKFLFTQDHFHLKVRQLSGGEKARLQLAKILLEPCDVLVLDEPTNDLDIDSIEVLEDTLSELKTALVLISHDRSFISNICNQFLALQGAGDWNFFADLDQWLTVKDEKPQKLTKAKEEPAPLKTKKKKLSYKDQREFETIEQKVQDQEAELDALNQKMIEPLSSEELQDISKTIAQLQDDIQTSYDRWQELEDLQK